ncbi:MAG: hypothetical protein E5W55_02065 [Mesorhizobium sp.]|nr:MAG: hypothetical protein E5W55_02065 [Mesorhizobium sp.]
MRIVVGGDVVLDADFPLWQIAMGTFTDSEGEPVEWSAEDDEHLRKSSVRRTETRLRAMRGDGRGSALRLHRKRHD